MQQYADQKPGCASSQSYDDIVAEGVQGCGTWISYPYFISIILLVRLIMINLFLALVVEGYLETLKENEAVVNPE
jgi:hypothetical protein